MKIETNWIPTDLNQRSSAFGFTPKSTPATNSATLPTFKGLLAEKNFADLIQNDDVRNKDATYIIGSRLFDAVVDVNGRGDFLSIQEAINAGKTRIFIRAGTYLIDSAITLPDNSIIVGENQYTTILKNNGFENDGIFSETVATNIEISNLYLNGNGVTGSIGINVPSGLVSSSIKNCFFVNFRDSAINARILNTKIIYNRFSGCLQSIKPSLASTSNLITDNYITASENNAIGLEVDGIRTIISNNIIVVSSSKTNTVGIIESGDSDVNIITNNIVVGFVDSITIIGADTIKSNNQEL